MVPADALCVRDSSCGLSYDAEDERCDENKCSSDERRVNGQLDLATRRGGSLGLNGTVLVHMSMRDTQVCLRFSALLD